MSKLFSNILNNNSKQTLFLDEILSDLNILNSDQLNSETLSYFLKNLDDYDAFFSTQQLKNIDYSKFSNHVFFDSAVNKLDFAFKKILSFPYDANEIEHLEFINSLDGYTDYILRNEFPKSLGAIQFNGNTKIVIYDKQGYILSDSKEKNEGLLSPKNNDFSFTFFIKPDVTSNIEKQCIFKKVILDNNNKIIDGFVCYTQKEQNDLYLCFHISSSLNNISSIFKTKIDENLMQHVCINVFDIINNKINVEFIINNKLSNLVNKNVLKLYSSLFPEQFLSKDVQFILGEGNINFLNNSGDSIELNNCYHVIDEFIYESRRLNNDLIKKRLFENIKQNKYTLLYLRFNEPKGQYENSQLVLDYSGNKLHGLLFNIDDDTFVNDTSNIKTESLLKLESLIINPVLNGHYNEILLNRNKLLNNAKYYDENNSNLIFNLMPKHYFINQGVFENLSNFVNQNNFSNENLNNQNKLKDLANNHIVNIALIWAKFFDELKLYIDSITNLLDLDYDNLNKNDYTSLYLPLLCKLYGFKFSEIFVNITNDQLQDKNILFENIRSQNSIRKIQNLLWKRILINSQDFLRSKGTKNSIKTLFNSLGLESDSFINIIETSSNSIVTQNENYDLIHKKLNSINLYNNINSEYNDLHVSNKHFVMLKNLKTSNNLKGLNTDWSFETFIKFNSNLQFKKIQSILKFNFENKCFMHLYFKKNNIDSKLGNLILEYSPFLFNTNYNQKIEIENINLFDIEKYICISQSLNTEEYKLLINLTVNNIANEIIAENIYVTNDLIINIPEYYLNRLSGYNKENIDIIIGDFNQINQNNYLENINENTDFQGELIKLRYWKKYLSKNEKIRHSNDISNIAEEIFDIKKQNLVFDFILKNINDQNLTDDDIAEKIKIKYINEINDLNKLNCYHYDDNIDKNKLFNDVIINTKKFNSKIDESNLRNRIKIISFKDEQNKLLSGNNTKFPSYKLPNTYNNQVSDKLYVDMSITKFIDDDISKLLLNIDSFNEILNKNMSLYQASYYELDKLKDDYFSKYNDKDLINYNSLNNIFKFFDNIVNNIINDAISFNINNKGFNLVYESHLLERHKYEYKNKFSNSNIHDEINYNSTLDFNKIKKHYRNKSYNKDREI